MKKVKIVIVEDEFVISEDIRIHLEQSDYEVTGFFNRAEKALPFILHHHPDILLVDIKLVGQEDGIWLVKNVQRSFAIPIVYITANSDQATYERARETHPHAFLIKPFTPANLLSAVDLALYNFSQGLSLEQIERPIAGDSERQPFSIHSSIFIRTKGKHQKISCEDILFIEADGSYIHLQTKLDRFTLSHNLSYFQKKILLPNLIRVHRSYMVNMDHVDSFEEAFIYIKNYKIPLSENFKAEFTAGIKCL